LKESTSPLGDAPEKSSPKGYTGEGEQFFKSISYRMGRFLSLDARRLSIRKRRLKSRLLLYRIPRRFSIYFFLFVQEKRNDSVEYGSPRCLEMKPPLQHADFTNSGRLRHPAGAGGSYPPLHRVTKQSPPILAHRGKNRFISMPPPVEKQKDHRNRLKKIN
jgi:hypothetical protein